jgi:hypothetical protein
MDIFEKLCKYEHLFIKKKLCLSSSRVVLVLTFLKVLGIRRITISKTKNSGQSDLIRIRTIGAAAQNLGSTSGQAELAVQCGDPKF